MKNESVKILVALRNHKTERKDLLDWSQKPSQMSV